MSPGTRENSINLLSSRVAAVETDVRNIVASVDRLATNVDGMSRALGDSKRTDWATLAAWSTVIIAVITSLGYMAVKPVTVALFETREEIRYHLREGAHPSAEERIRSIEKELGRVRQEQLRRTDRVYKGN